MAKASKTKSQPLFAEKEMRAKFNQYFNNFFGEKEIRERNYQELIQWLDDNIEKIEKRRQMIEKIYQKRIKMERLKSLRDEIIQKHYIITAKAFQTRWELKKCQEMGNEEQELYNFIVDYCLSLEAEYSDNPQILAEIENIKEEIENSRSQAKEMISDLF